MRRSTWWRAFSLLAALALVAGACGGRDDDDGGASTDDTATDGGDTGGEPGTAPGFDGETIRLGVLTPTSGGVAIIGNPLTAGNQAYFDALNEEEGGVAGRYPVELVIEDTAYDPTQAAARYSAIVDDVVMFVQVLGTQVVKGLVGDLEEDNVVAAPASLDSEWVGEPNLLPIGGPYQIQAINGVDWYFTEGGGEGQTLCVLASDDEYGDAGLAGAEFAAEQLGIEIASVANYPAPGPTRPAQTFEPQLSQLQGDGCEVVVFVATPTDTGALATTLSESGGYAPTILGQSPTWLGSFAAVPYLQENFYLMSEGTEYGDESVPGMAELVRVKDQYAPDQEPDIYFNFGYLQAQATHQLLEKAVELGDLSRDGIMAAMDEVGTLEFDGLFGDYPYGGPDDRVPPTRSSIFKPNPEKPGGLELVARDHEAEFAADFEF